MYPSSLSLSFFELSLLRDIILILMLSIADCAMYAYAT